MARYVAKVRTPWPAEKSFGYIADFRNLEEWDPGVERARLIEGTEPGTGAAYAVKVPGTHLVYKTSAFEAPHTTVLKAQNKTLTSLDRITVERDGAGSVVTYDAELTLNGVLGVFDPLLRIAFKRIGDRAANGLRRALEATPTT